MENNQYYSVPNVMSAPAPAPGASGMKHALRRMIFAVASMLILIIFTYLVMSAQPGFAGVGARSSQTAIPPMDSVMSRISTDLLLIIVPALVAAVISALLGSVRSAAAKQVFAVLSVVFLAGALPLTVLLVRSAYIGLGERATMPAVAIMTVFMIGFLLRPAVLPRNRKGFVGALGAVFAALGTGSGVGFAAGFAVILQLFLSIPGAGRLMITSIMTRDFAVLFWALCVILVIVGLARAIFDFAAALCGFEFENERFSAADPARGGGKSRRIVIIILAAVVLCVILLTLILPMFSAYGPTEQTIAEKLLAPGTNGHVLGTDSVGRDMFARLAFGSRSSLLYALGSFLIAAVLGVGVGIGAGFLDGLDRTILEGVIYVLGFVPAVFLPVLGVSNVPFVLVFAVFWGGLAEKTAMLVANKRGGMSFWRAAAPLAEELVFSFGLILMFGTLWTYTGLFIQEPASTLGTLLSAGTQNLLNNTWILSVPLAAFFVYLVVFGLLQAALFGDLRGQDET